MKILAITGSLRAESFNTKALKVAQAVAPDGVEVIQADLGGVPPYREEDYQQGFPAAVEALRNAIRDADAVLIATPEYNYSIPGVLKNAIDWISRPPSSRLRGSPSRSWAHRRVVWEPPGRNTTCVKCLCSSTPMY